MSNAFTTWVEDEVAKLKHVKLTWLIESIAKDIVTASTVLDTLIDDVPVKTPALASLDAALKLIQSASTAVEASFANATPPAATPATPAAATPAS